MQMSKKKIKKAYYYKDNPNEVYSMKKYILQEELNSYGVSIDENSDIDTSTMQEIFFIIIKRITAKYKIEEA